MTTVVPLAPPSAPPASPVDAGPGQPVPTPRRSRLSPAQWLTRAATAELSRSSSLAARALLGVAGLALWLVLFGLVFSGLYESHAQHGLYSSLRDQLAKATAPLNDAVPTGTGLAVLNAPGAKLHDLVVVQGVTGAALRAGPGHKPGTPLPGQPGVSLLLGRAASFGGAFAHIADLVKGETISVTTGEGSFSYIVEDVRRSGDPFPAPLAAGGSQLTLVTAESDGWRSGWAPSHAVFVDALLKGNAVPAGDGAGVPTTADDILMSDTSRLYPLVLWLLLLMATLVAAAWARINWGRWQTYLLATPVAAAALWGATTCAWLLLPNLI